MLHWLIGGVYESYCVQSMDVTDLWNMLYKSLQLSSTAITFVDKSGVVRGKNSDDLSNGLTTSEINKSISPFFYLIY